MKTIRTFGTSSLILAIILGVGFVSPAFSQLLVIPVIVSPGGKTMFLGTLGGIYSLACLVGLMARRKESAK